MSVTFPVPPSDSIAGRVAVVTGAAGGIGLGCAAALHRRGARVVLADLDVDRAVESARLLGDGAVAVPHDVARAESSVRLVEEVRERFGRLEILVNNAGVGPRPAPVQDLDPDEFDRVMNVNTRGVFLATRAAAPLLIEAGGRGRIVNVSSVMGQSADVEVCHYVASKHAVIGLTRAWALEFARHGITVNAVCPTNVDTPMIQNPAMYALFAPDVTNPTREDVIPGFTAINALPVPWVEVQDISEGMLYLAAESGRYITGETLTIAAGWNANNAA